MNLPVWESSCRPLAELRFWVHSVLSVLGIWVCVCMQEGHSFLEISSPLALEWTLKDIESGVPTVQVLKLRFREKASACPHPSPFHVWPAFIVQGS